MSKVTRVSIIRSFYTNLFYHFLNILFKYVIKFLFFFNTQLFFLTLKLFDNFPNLIFFEVFLI